MSKRSGLFFRNVQHRNTLRRLIKALKTFRSSMCGEKDAVGRAKDKRHQETCEFRKLTPLQPVYPPTRDDKSRYPEQRRAEAGTRQPARLWTRGLAGR